MRVQVEADVLADAVKAAASLSRGPGATNCVKLEATDQLVVTGGDGETYAEFTVPATVIREGATLTPAKVFAKAVPKLNGTVELMLDDDDALGVETVTSRLTLPTAPAQDYPKPLWPEGEPVDVTGSWDRLRLIAYASAMALESMFQAVKLLPDGWAEAYDKTRMARTEIPEGLSASVRKDSFDFAARVIEGSVSIATSNNAVAFYGKGARVFAVTVATEVKSALTPQIAALLGAGPALTCNRKALLEAIGLIEVVKDDERQAIRVDIVDGEATLTARSAEAGEVVSIFPVEGETPWPFGITGGYVRDVLSRTSAEDVTLQFSETNRGPIIVESEGIVHMFGPNMAAFR